MTTVLETPATAGTEDPSGLVTPEVFDKLVEFIITRHRVTPDYAARLFRQTLVYLKAVADNPNIRIVPDISVDPGWHAFIEHTIDYAEFSERVAGRFMHHVPILTQDMITGEAMARTIPALRATGYRVDMEFWRTAESCCPPNPCV